LTPNDPYRGRTTPLTSNRCILYIYSTNICTEYFKHGIYSPFIPLQNAVCFIIPTYLVPVLFTFYIQSVLKLKKVFSKFSLFHNSNMLGSCVIHISCTGCTKIIKVFSLQNAVCFLILTYLVPALFTFYIQGVLKLKKNFRRQKVKRRIKSHLPSAGIIRSSPDFPRQRVKG
jgi:hypothetical protein